MRAEWAWFSYWTKDNILGRRPCLLTKRLSLWRINPTQFPHSPSLVLNTIHVRCWVNPGMLLRPCSLRINTLCEVHPTTLSGTVFQKFYCCIYLFVCLFVCSARFSSEPLENRQHHNPLWLNDPERGNPWGRQRREGLRGRTDRLSLDHGKNNKSRLFWSILKSRLFKRFFLSLKTCVRVPECGQFGRTFDQNI